MFLFLMLQAIEEKVQEQQGLQKQGQDIQLELKEMDYKVNKFQRDSKEAASKVILLCLNSKRIMFTVHGWKFRNINITSTKFIFYLIRWNKCCKNTTGSPVRGIFSVNRTVLSILPLTTWRMSLDGSVNCKKRKTNWERTWTCEPWICLEKLKRR